MPVIVFHKASLMFTIGITTLDFRCGLETPEIVLVIMVLWLQWAYYMCRNISGAKIVSRCTGHEVRLSSFDCNYSTMWMTHAATPRMGLASIDRQLTIDLLCLAGCSSDLDSVWDPQPRHQFRWRSVGSQWLRPQRLCDCEPTIRETTAAPRGAPSSNYTATLAL